MDDLVSARLANAVKGIFSMLTAVLLVVSLGGCADNFLSQQPEEIISDEEVFSSPDLILGVLSNYYSRLPSTQSLDQGAAPFAMFDEAMWSGGGGNDWRNRLQEYGYGSWGIWDYNLIRDINLFIERIRTTEQLEPEERRQYEAEARFLRAYMYFELVKRMGGVPIITQTYERPTDGNVEELQFPRNTEAEVYDFIAAELDTVQADLPTETRATRANKWTALAMKSRAMLYAGSIAKYNSQMAQPITLPGNEVGIPPSRADGYYQQALAAAEEIIESGRYHLYERNPNLKENFYEAITREENNPEVIWAEDATTSSLPDAHLFTYQTIPRSLREDNLGSSELSPGLNLVEDYEYLDGSSGELQTRTADGDYVYYDDLDDIFANKDPRLWGTVIYPGSEFKGQNPQMQAGVLVWNEQEQSYEKVTSQELGTEYEDGGLLTGAGGPHASRFNVSNTGFYLRKYVDSEPGSSERGTQSGMWWVRYRYAEVLLNAAEAAFELGQQGKALRYINRVRERAGFGPNSLSSLTLEDFVHERRVELAFENHRLYDLKRWRLAHRMWDGDPQNEDAQIGALYPYRVVRPGHPNHNKYVFVKQDAPRFESPRFFRLGNYYSEIGQGIRNDNPKIVQNPFH